MTPAEQGIRAAIIEDSQRDLIKALGAILFELRNPTPAALHRSKRIAKAAIEMAQKDAACFR